MVGSLQLHFAHMRNHRRDAAGWTTAVLERRIYSCPITLEAPSFLGNMATCAGPEQLQPPALLLGVSPSQGRCRQETSAHAV